MSFNCFGIYYANELGQTAQLVALPDVNDDPQPYLSWGYGAQPDPGAGQWIQTPDLRDTPYDVPAEATAVRLHIKAKAKTVKWTTVDSIGDIQVAVKPAGSIISVNECVHATACQKGNADLPGEQISHITVDVALDETGSVDIFHYPSIVGYANADLIVYLSGCWMPPAEIAPPTT